MAKKHDDEMAKSATLGGQSVVFSLRGKVEDEPALELLPTPGAETHAAGPLVSEESRYVASGVIGEGAFGVVHRVLDRDLRRELAMKVLKPRPGRERQDIKRFVEEAQATAQLEHPNIVPVHELGNYGDSVYYTMKLLHGQTLALALGNLKANDARAAREWSLTSLIQVFLQICQAIDFAHAKGVVHRDLKPHNVMLGDYGEVILMDWGLAKVVIEGEVRTEGLSPRTMTMDGVILGSPAYMSPEQAAGEIDKIDARSDLYALGAILYEILTLCVPFESENTAWLLARILMEEPEAPRKRAPERDIPVELQRICLQALSKNPGLRQESARQLRDQVQAWLEAELERGRRRELAEAKANEGIRSLAVYRKLEREVRALEHECNLLQGRFRPWQPLSAKREMLDRLRELELGRRGLDRAFGNCVAQLTTAVGLETENRTARGALSELYWERFLEAELRSDERGMAYFRPLVEVYHDGKYTRELEGDGSLTLDSAPGGAEVWLYEYVEEDIPLVLSRERLLGTTPLGPIKLAMGSYLVILRKQGYRDVRYPVFISRNRDWKGTVNLYTDEEIGSDFVYAPAGSYVCGGDEDSFTFALPRSEPMVEDFFIAVHPVTIEQYLEFLNDLAATNPAEAATRTPRRHTVGDSYLIPGADGRYQLPEMDAEGDLWEPRWPVIGVSYFDALAYCEWRSVRERRAFRLPTDLEWEKASRGVDGRWFPWGDRYDGSLCNMKDSLRERPAVVPVDAFPTDVSPYGVRGTAGNVRDWTWGEVPSGEGGSARLYVMVRGGCWGFGPSGLKSTFRFGVSPTLVDGQIGFRVARTPHARRR